MTKRGTAKKKWNSSAGILAGQIKITGDIVNFDSSELWDALHEVDALGRRVEPPGGVEMPVISRDRVAELPKSDD